MTEQEAIELLQEDMGKVCFVGRKYEAIKMAVSALEEIQQYRACGTVEEIRRMQKYSALAKKHGTIGKVIDSCAEYEEIGTVEECREARKKQMPVKVFRELWKNKFESCKCGNCGKELSNDLLLSTFEGEYCYWCGQKLDWSEDEVPDSR